MITFEQARREPKLRQRHLEERDFGVYSKYIKDVRYIPNKLTKGKTTPLAGVERPRRTDLGIKGAKSMLYVYSRIYRDHIIRNDADFGSIVEVHEPIHAEQNFNARPTYFGALQRFIKENGIEDWVAYELIYNYRNKIAFDTREREIEAYARQLEIIRNNNIEVSPKFKKAIRQTLSLYLDLPSIAQTKLYSNSTLINVLASDYPNDLVSKL